jgi:16S rRNA (cytidine1402-2'-O)-methyltransferase
MGRVKESPGPGDAGGLLVLAGTPIGQDADASPRLAEELARADVIATEDTRRLRRLTKALGVEPDGRIVSYFEANETARTPDLVRALLAGSRVLVVTDAGMPSVSDPGYRLVAAAVEAGVRVTAVPGPSAVLTALALSGLPVDRFCFEGFLPRKGGGRSARLEDLAGEPRTMVFFEAPHRLAVSLADMAATFGSARPAAVCRELTKTYEEIKRGPLGDLAAWASEGEVRGEITVVVGGAVAVAGEVTPAEMARLVAVREDAGQRRKEAIAEVAAGLGVPKREIFDAVVAAKNVKDSEDTGDTAEDEDAQDNREDGDE